MLLDMKAKAQRGRWISRPGLDCSRFDPPGLSEAKRTVKDMLSKQGPS